jgi:mRNA-degrading endonuclease RelE of RelBE toxin-antitoxin system
MERPVFIHPKALKALQNFPRTTRLSIGKAIRELQKGYVLSMPVSRHMPSVALGVSEIRVKVHWSRPDLTTSSPRELIF